MICPNCKSELPNKARFCSFCGSALTTSSPSRRSISQRIVLISIGSIIIVLLGAIIIIFLIRDIGSKSAAITGEVVVKSKDGSSSTTIASSAGIPETSQDAILEASTTLSPVKGLAYSPDGRAIAAIGSRGIYLLDSSSLAEVIFIENPNGGNGVGFTTGGEFVVAKCANTSICLWQVSNDTLIRQTAKHTNPVSSMAVAPDGEILASGSKDGSVHLWRMDDGISLGVHTPSDQLLRASIKTVDVSINGRHVAFSREMRDAIEIWQPDSGIFGSFLGDGFQVSSFSFSPDYSTLVSGHSNGMLRLWKVSEGIHLPKDDAIAQLERVNYLLPNRETFAWTAFRSTDGRFILVLRGKDGAMYIAKPGETISPLRPDNDGISEVDENGIPLVIDGYERLNRLTVLRYIHELGQIAFGTEMDLVQVQSLDEAGTLANLYVYDSVEDVMVNQQTGGVYVPINGAFTSMSGERLRPTFAIHEHLLFPQGGGSINQVDYSPDGELVAVASSYGIHLLDAETLHEDRFITIRAPVNCIAFSPDGKHLASSTNNGSISLWKLGE